MTHVGLVVIGLFCFVSFVYSSVFAQENLTKNIAVSSNQTIDSPTYALNNSTPALPFSEDYTEKAEPRTIEMILEYCVSHPQGNVTMDLVESGMISTFYIGYTCAKASQEKQKLDFDKDAAGGFQDSLDATKKYRYD